jgi:hypothetical protein
LLSLVGDKLGKNEQLGAIFNAGYGQCFAGTYKKTLLSLSLSLAPQLFIHQIVLKGKNYIFSILH